MKGRRPKPTTAKILQGTFRKDRMNPHEPQPDVILNPPAPSYLNRAARRIWDATAPRLAELGILTELDHTAYAVFCSSSAEYDLAARDVEKRGLVVETIVRRGNSVLKVERQNPYIKIRDNALKMANRMAAEFGLTPTTRPRLRATPIAQRSALSRFTKPDPDSGGKPQ
jgi:P27 family predicted phage terminase small subunit